MSTSHYSSLYLVIGSCCLFAAPTAKGVTCTGLNWQIYYNMLCFSDPHCKNVITKLRVARKFCDQKLVSVFRCSPFSCASQYKLTSAISTRMPLTLPLWPLWPLWPAKDSTTLRLTCDKKGSTEAPHFGRFGMINLAIDGVSTSKRWQMNKDKWVCLKIVYPYTQWLMIIIPTKWL